MSLLENFATVVESYVSSKPWERDDRRRTIIETHERQAAIAREIYEAGLRGNEQFLAMRQGLSPNEQRRYKRAVLKQMHALPRVGNLPDYRVWTPLTPEEALGKR